MYETAEYYRGYAAKHREIGALAQAAAYDRMAALIERAGTPEPVKEQCGTCHFQRHTQCHRYPPTRPDPNDGRSTHHRHVEEYQWCGEWKPKS